MLPGITGVDLTDQSISDSKVSSDKPVFFTGCCSSSDFSNIGIGQLRLRILLARAAVVSLATLPLHVLHILGTRAQEQVIGANAERVIAMMADMFAAGRSPMVQLPRDPRSKGHPGFGWFPCQDAITVRVRARRPEPTALRLVDLLPEPIGQWAGSVFAVAKRGAVVPAAGFHHCRLNGEEKAAGDTNAFDALDFRSSRDRKVNRAAATASPALAEVRTVGVRAKVSRIDAAGKVTGMANDQSIGDRTIRQFPTNTVSVGTAGIARGATDLAISVGIKPARPRPALIGAAPVNLFPEAISQRTNFPRHRINSLLLNSSTSRQQFPIQ